MQTETEAKTKMKTFLAVAKATNDTAEDNYADFKAMGWVVFLIISYIVGIGQKLNKKI